MSFTDKSEKDESCPSLILSTDKTNIFVADQTPTPTRLIRNCEEIGLFDDLLRHDNPFDETFRKAIEQTFEETSCSRPLETLQCSISTEDLHTPQVYPHLDEATHSNSFHSTISEQIETISRSSCVALDVPCLPAVGEEHISSSERLVVNNNDLVLNGNEDFLQSPKIVHIVHPQVITWQFPNQSKIENSAPAKPAKQPKAILPKPSASVRNDKLKPSTNLLIPPASSHHEPSSASLTPTSQLPIKERLKAILNNNQNKRFFQEPKTIPQKNLSNRKKFAGEDDSLERKRAACVRYRSRVRTEQKELKKENEELKEKNKKLLERVKFLEKELQKCKNAVQIIPPGANQNESCQLRIPPSSINLVINVPSLLLPVNNEQNSLRQT